MQAPWLRGDNAVSVPVVTSRVRKRYSCPVVMVRRARSALLSQARSWAESDREADAETLLADGKEAPGLDQYQLVSAQAQVALPGPGDAALRLSGA